MKRSRGLRSKTRHKLKHGRFSIAEAMQEFKQGDKVRININPSVHKGMPSPKFQGWLGTIKGKRGNSFELEIMDGKKSKSLLSKPEHLKSEKIQEKVAK